VEWAAGLGHYYHACWFTWLLYGFVYRGRSLRRQVEIHQVALEAVKLLDNPEMAGHLLNGLGNAYAELQMFDEAEVAYLQAREKLEGNKLGMAKTMANLGLLYAEAGDFDRAEDLCMQAQVIYLELDYQRGIAHNLDNIGLIHLGRGDYALSTQYLLDALQLNLERNHHKDQLAAGLMNLGRSYAAVGEHARAVARYNEAIATYRLVFSDRGEAITELYLGRSLAQLGDLPQARTAWTRAHATLEAAGDPRARDVAAELDRVNADAVRAGSPCSPRPPAESDDPHHQRTIKTTVI
jgi:tetratricopeptide (TPR) repeat protein